jgi:5'-3' exonuclease
METTQLGVCGGIMSKVLLIDLSSIFWQNWHATKDQEVSRAFDDKYDHVGICLDSPPYKRKQIDPNYKAQRDAPSPGAVAQLERVKDRISKDGYPLFASPGAEADDVIATIAGNTSEPLDILTGDKDLCQVIYSGKDSFLPGAKDISVRVISTQTGDVIDEDGVKAKFGVSPDNMVDFLAICGDKADNVPGVRGIGPKGAVQLIEQFGSVEELYWHIDAETPEFQALKPATAEKLARGFGDLKKSYELVKLDTGLSLPIESLFKPRVPEVLTEEESGFEGHSEASESDIVIDCSTGVPKSVGDSVIKVQGSDEYSKRLEPQDIKEAWKLAVSLQNSRLYEKFGSSEAILAAILRGRELGFGAISSLEAMNSVMGNGLTWTVDAIAGLVMKSGKAEYLKPIEMNDKIATYKTHRKDDPDPEPIVMSYTLQDAEDMGLLGKKFWKTMRPTMLRRRALSQICREVYPDVVGGLFSKEELE